MSDTNTAATRAEAARIADLKRELASLRAFGTQLAPPDPLRVIDMRRNAMVDIYNDTVWAEFSVAAACAFRDSAEALLRAREEAVRVYGSGM